MNVLIWIVIAFVIIAVANASTAKKRREAQEAARKAREALQKTQASAPRTQAYRPLESTLKAPPQPTIRSVFEQGEDDPSHVHSMNDPRVMTQLRFDEGDEDPAHAHASRMVDGILRGIGSVPAYTGTSGSLGDDYFGEGVPAPKARGLDDMLGSLYGGSKQTAPARAAITPEQIRQGIVMAEILKRPQPGVLPRQR